jgi:hypothetical protein
VKNGAQNYCLYQSRVFIRLGWKIVGVALEEVLRCEGGSLMSKRKIKEWSRVRSGFFAFSMGMAWLAALKAVGLPQFRPCEQ